MKVVGVKCVLLLKVGGVFYFLLMNFVKVELEVVINVIEIYILKCFVYQNVDVLFYIDFVEIKVNLVVQFIVFVCWIQIVKNMVVDGVDDFIECGLGVVL